jgi:hypothetical protein
LSHCICFVPSVLKRECATGTQSTHNMNRQLLRTEQLPLVTTQQVPCNYSTIVALSADGEADNVMG